MDIRYNTFSNKQNFTSVGLMLIFVCIVMLGFVASTLAFFYYSDFSNEALTMSGKVKIEAVGEGDLTIEDDTKCNLKINFDDEYDVLIPGMPIDMPANCKVYASTTKPLLRAMLTLDFESPTTALETYSDEYTDESIVLQRLLSQFADEIEGNGWYMHTDSYYYYVGVGATIQGNSTILAEVDATGGNVVVPFIDSEVKFPTEVDSAYSGSEFKVKITFQAIQNYIPDTQGNKMENTINNSQKIFNRFYVDKFVETPIEMFTVTKSGDQVILNLDPNVTYPDTVVLPTTDAEGNKITTIGKDFGQNSTIKNIVVTSPDYTTIEKGAFENNNQIENIDLSGTSITEIPENCFANSTISTIQLPSSVENIAREAFSNSNLTSIILNDGLKEIHAEAFNQTKIISLYIPASVNYISSHQIIISSPTLTKIEVSEENATFYDIDDMCVLSSDRFIKMAPLSEAREFTIPEGVREIAYGAFYNCDNLEVVNLPTTLEAVGQDGFRYCDNLSKLNVQSAVTYGAHSLDYLKIQEIILNYSVLRKTIEYASLLKKVIFAANVTSVDDIVVANCAAVKVIIFQGTKPPTFATTTFLSGVTLNNLKIYVPDSALNTYKSVANLSGYVNRIYPMSQYTG